MQVCGVVKWIHTCMTRLLGNVIVMDGEGKRYYFSC